MKKILLSIQKSCRIVCQIIFINLISFNILCGQQHKVDYREIFGERYSEACTYLSKNHWISDTIIKHQINPCFAQALIFPEIIRYSSIQDKVELQGLFSLYVQYGEDYANFSVGRFQIKPSFAEQVERDARAHVNLKNEKILREIEIADTPHTRLARVKRLENQQWQLQYILWFVKIVESKFDIIWKTEEEKLIFFATAYNCGYNHTAAYIKNISERKHYHTSLFRSTVLYNYGSISLQYWNNCQSIELKN